MTMEGLRAQLKSWTLINVFPFSILIFFILNSTTLNSEEIIYGRDVENIFERIDELDLYDRALYHYVPQPEEIEIRQAPPPNLEPYYAYLKKGTIIYEANTNNPSKLPRDLFAKVLLTDYSSEKLWVLNSKGEKPYWIHSKNIIDVTEELTLTPRVATREEFPEATRYHTTNEVFQLRHELSYGLHSQSITAIKATFAPELPNASGDTLDYTLYALWQLPINLGWTVRYESASASNEEVGQVSWLAFSTGPKVTYQVWEGEKYNLELGAEVTHGLIYRGNFNEQEGFEGDFLRLNLQAQLNRKFSWGSLFIASRWLNQRTSIDRQFEQPFASPSLGRTSSGFMSLIGMSFDTELSL